MPKHIDLINSWIKNYTELILQEDKVFCRTCSKTITCHKKFQIDQHIKTSSHQRNCANKNKQRTLQESLASTSKNSEKNTFNYDLCNALISSNIPLSKLNNPNLRLFLEKYCTIKNIPDESNLRKNYVNNIYIDIMSQIKETVGTNYIYFTVDETTDSCGRYIANLLIGVLNERFSKKSYLIATKELDKTNNVTICRFIQEGLANFYLPEAVPSEKVLLMLSDAAPYMIKAGHNLRIFYKNLIHVTCLAHGINRVAEEIRNQYPIVNDLINNVKKVFLKAPLRIQVYRDHLPNISLPPQPIITRWGTWMKAALFYADNFKKIKEVIFMLSDSSAATVICKTLFDDPVLPQQLAFIKANYFPISEIITKLETQGMSLTESVSLINNFETTINNVQGTTASKISNKLSSVIQKNDGFKDLRNIAIVLKGEKCSDLKMDPHIICKFKYAPITSVDVERSFSVYKNILSDRRQSFLIDNLEKHLIINCFHCDT